MPEQLGRHQSVAAPKPAPPLGALAGCSRPQGTAGRQTGSNSQALKHPALQQYYQGACAPVQVWRAAPGALAARAGVQVPWAAGCARPGCRCQSGLDRALRPGEAHGGARRRGRPERSDRLAPPQLLRHASTVAQAWMVTNDTV